MKFYRLHDKDYDLKTDWKSYCYRYGYLEAAMLADMKEEWELEDAEEIEEKYFDGVLTDADIQKIWLEKVDNGFKPFNAHPGASCFSDKRELAEYIEEQPYYRNGDFDVIEFEGEYVMDGMDGEEIAEVKKVIRRISIEEFLKEFEEIQQYMDGISPDREAGGRKRSGENED